MHDIFAGLIAGRLGLQARHVAGVIGLLTDGATVPFISRYRKEMTGSMDEVKVAEVKEQLDRLTEMERRKQTIVRTIEEQGALTDDLRRRIDSTWDATELEDIYLPYKPKRKTRAVRARELGLEPLARMLMKQDADNALRLAAPYVNADVPTPDDALQGARDIVAEWVSENAVARDAVRAVFARTAVVTSRVVKGKEAEGIKYKDYFDWSEQLRKCPSHRLLAMRRGEKEGFLKVTIAPADDAQAVERLSRLFVKKRTDASRQVAMAVEDAFARLLEPAIETEFGAQSKEAADTEAIKVFVQNLRQLLMSAPLGEKRTLALDPGFRTGCKTVCLDAQGNLLHHTAIFPHPPAPASRQAEAVGVLRDLVARYGIEAIAIGNGTASRETEAFVRSAGLPAGVRIFIVSEDGASIYSASKTARDEFPDEDVTVRGAVSIGRRLMDPLAELVKIDPKSIGVGQYQHDVDQSRLKASLDAVVESCVNLVGVNVNTASRHLLTYVSGLGPQLAQNIVDYRAANGPFRSRAELRNVPRLGPKAFEQCAGFLRIPGASNPLDDSAVHPEAYPIVRRMASDSGCTIEALISDASLRRQIDLNRYVDAKTGLPTLTDIMKELEKPGRDPREQLTEFSFAEGVTKIEHLVPGMELPGIVTNITAFGAFVDVGVKQDGLVHISRMSDRFVSDPSTIVSLHQHVTVKVEDVDLQRGRISLSLVK